MSWDNSYFRATHFVVHKYKRRRGCYAVCNHDGPAAPGCTCGADDHNARVEALLAGGAP